MAPDVGQRFLDDASHLHTGRPGDRGRKPIFHHQLELAAFADLAIQFDDGLHGADQEPLPGTLQPQVIDGVAQASDRPLERLYLVFRLSGAVYTLRHPPENLHRLKGVREVLQDHVVQLAGYPLTFGLPDLAQGLFGPLALGNVLYSTLVTRDTSTSIIDGARVGRDPHSVSVLTVHLYLEAAHEAIPQRALVELLPAFRLNVELVPDIGDVPEQLLRRLVAQHPGHRGVRGQKPSVDGGLEDSFDGVLEDRTVLLLGLPALATHLSVPELPLDGAVEPGEVILHEVVLGTGFHGRDGCVLPDPAAHYDERHVYKPLTSEQTERRQRAEVRHGMVGDDEIPTASIERGLHGRRGVDPLPVRVVPTPAQHPHQEQGVVFGVLDEQDSELHTHSGTSSAQATPHVSTRVWQAKVRPLFLRHDSLCNFHHLKLHSIVTRAPGQLAARGQNIRK